MKRHNVRGNNKFARYGLRGHSVYTYRTYRGGTRL